MEPKGIRDRVLFETWLNARPEATRQAEAVALAQRCAARVFPDWGSAMGTEWALTTDLTALPILRLLLTSGVAAVKPTPEVKAAAVYAAAVYVKAYSDAADAYAAAVYATDAVVAYAENDSAADVYAADAVAFAAKHSVWNQLRIDAQVLVEGGTFADRPLWSELVPSWFTKADTKTRAIWAKDPPGTWDFWIRWWDGILSGQQLDWNLQEQVALIPDEIWQQGPQAVAAAIREIELELAISRTPNAEIIRINPETGLFQAVPDTRLPADHLRDVTQKIADAADTFGGLEQSDNRYTAARPDIDYLRRRLDRDRANPRALHDLCRSTARRLMARVNDQSLPLGDPLVEDCLRQLDEAAIDIVGFDEKTREVVKSRTTIRIERLDLNAMPDMIRVADQMALIVEGDLVEDIPADARLISNPNAPSELRAAATNSQIGRWSRVYAWYKGLGPGGKTLVTGAIVAALGGANVVFEFMGNVWRVLQYLWSAIF